VLQCIVKLLVAEVISAIGKAIADFMKVRRLKKESKEKVKEVMNEKDPKIRAKRISDLLNTL